MRILVLQHVAFEPAQSLVKWAALKGHKLCVCRLFKGDDLPALGSFDSLFILGGPMGVHDVKQYPWLKAEAEFIKRAIDADKNIIGICLGAQLVALCLGANVSKNPQPEIGWFKTKRIGAHPLSQHFADLLAFHWHVDTFALPPAAVKLAASEACANQAFIYRDNILGLQCHLEFCPATVKRLLVNSKKDLIAAPYVQTGAEMLANKSNFSAANRAFYSILNHFFGLLDS